MLTNNDRKVAALLLSEGHLTREQLNECAGIQERLEEQRSLASIVVARRYVSADRLKEILNRAVQRARSREVPVGAGVGGRSLPSAPSLPPPPPLLSAPPPPVMAPASDGGPGPHYKTDVDLARLLVVRKVVTEQQARECLALLQRVLVSRPTARLTQVILKRRYASRDALRHILEEFEERRGRQGSTSSQSAMFASAELPTLPATPQGSGSFNRMQESGSFARFGEPSASPSNGYPAPPPPPPPLNLAPPPSHSDPFASVKPQRSMPEPEAPLRFGSGADFMAAPPRSNPLTSGDPADSEQTIQGGPGGFPGLNSDLDAPAPLGGFNSGAQPFQPGPEGSGAAFHFAELPRNPSGPMPIVAPISSTPSQEMFGSNGGGNPMFGSNPGANPMFGSNVGGHPMFGSNGGGNPMFGSNPGGNPMFGSNGGLNGAGLGMPPSSPAFDSVGSREAPPGFRTMDLGDDEPTISPAAPPMGSGASPFASGPMPGPFASGPQPSPFASGPSPAPSPFASGPAPSPFASGPAPAAAPPDFRTFDLQADNEPTISPARGAPSGTREAPSTGGRAAGGDTREATREAARDKSKKTNRTARASQSRSRAADRRSRVAAAAPAAPRKGMSSDLLLLIGGVFVALAIGGGVWVYIDGARKRGQLRQALRDAQTRNDVEEAYEYVQKLREYEPDDKELEELEKELSNTVAQLRRTQKAEALLAEAAKLEDPREAAARCEDAVEVDPRFAAARVALGEYRYRAAHQARRNGDIPGYRNLLVLAHDSLREAMNYDGRLQKAYFLTAEVERDRNGLTDPQSYRQIENNYRQAIRLDKANWIGLLANARFSEIEGNDEAAMRAYNQAIEANKESRLALLCRGDLSRRKRRYSDAQKDVERLLELKAKDPDALMLNAHILIDENDLSGARAALDEALSADKGSAYGMALDAYWKFLKANENPDDATRQKLIAACDAAIDVDQHHYFPYRVRGQIILDEGKGDLTKARHDFRSAKEKATWVADNHFWNGKVMTFEEQFQIAEASYTECIKRDPKYAYAYANRGTVRRKLKRYDNALKDFDEAVRLDPKNAQILFQRVKVKWEILSSKNVEKSSTRWNPVLDDLNEAIAQNPNLYDAYGRRGYLYQKRNELKAAEADYEQAVKLDGDTYWNGVRGLLFFEQERYQDALDDFKKFLDTQTHSANPKLYDEVSTKAEAARREVEKQGS